MTQKIYTFILLLCLASCVVSAQQRSQPDDYSFGIGVEKKNRAKTSFPRSDTLYISFDYGYKNDIMAIQAHDTLFQSDTLNANNVLGFAGRMKIPKSFLDKPVDLLFNGRRIKTLKVKRRYSSVHLEFNRERNSFFWRYHRYKFIYL